MAVLKVREDVPDQSVDATRAFKVSAGLANSSVSRGRPLSFLAIISRCSCECRDKSLPLGKYCRSRPFVFSFEPRCQGLRGSLRDRNGAMAGQLHDPEGVGTGFNQAS